MKKPIALFLIATLFGLVGCGDDKKSEEMEFREAETTVQKLYLRLKRWLIKTRIQV